MRQREDDGGTAIKPKLLGPVVQDKRMASRGFESHKRRALVCVSICFVHQCCLECGPDCGVRRRSRIHEFRGSTFGLTAVVNAVNSAGWSEKVKCAVSHKPKRSSAVECHMWRAAARASPIVFFAVRIPSPPRERGSVAYYLKAGFRFE